MQTSIDHSRTVLAFGPFRWKPEPRALFKDGASLNLGSRARGILSILLERAGHLVKRSELVARVWGGGVVEEGTLRVHIALLRKALECDQIDGCYIETVNGLGYRFTGSVEYVPESGGPWAPNVDVEPPSTRMIGRDDVVSTLAQRLREKRLLTLVGPGGIGKTTVASTAMAQMRNDYPDGVLFVDFSAVWAEQLVTSTLADALGNPDEPAAPLAQRIDGIANRKMLVVLDNCEHVIDAVTPLAELLLLRTTDAHILATSREPLRAQGESLLRLTSLDVPPRKHRQSVADVLAYSAVQLFVERATANDHAFELTDADASMAAEICRRLDGLPLAIELAAAQVGLFGIRGLAMHLDELLDVLTQGRRTAPPRQQTLRATLQWSFDLLSEAERRALRRLSTITEGFDLKAACDVVAKDGIANIDVLDLVSRLTAKSLIVADSCEAGLLRLFQTTRSFVSSLQERPDNTLHT